jgi:hypothetical protein
MNLIWKSILRATVALIPFSSILDAAVLTRSGTIGTFKRIGRFFYRPRSRRYGTIPNGSHARRASFPKQRNWRNST